MAGTFFVTSSETGNEASEFIFHIASNTLRVNCFACFENVSQIKVLLKELQKLYNFKFYVPLEFHS